MSGRLPSDRGILTLGRRFQEESLIVGASYMPIDEVRHQKKLLHHDMLLVELLRRSSLARRLLRSPHSIRFRSLVLAVSVRAVFLLPLLTN